MTDALSALMALSCRVASAKQSMAALDAQSNETERTQAEEARKKAAQAALDAAREAKKHADDGGTFGFITNHIGVVGLIGLCTGQFYLVAEDLAAHEMQKNNNKTSMLTAGAAALGGPLGSSIAVGVENAMPDDWRKSVDDLGSVKDDDVRVANKVALTIVLAEAMAAATVASGGTTAPTYFALAGLAVSAATDVGDETGVTKKVFKSDAESASMVGHLTGAALGAGAGLASANSVWTTVAASGQAVSVLAQASEQTGLTKSAFGDDAAKVTIAANVVGATAALVGSAGAAASSDKSEVAKLERAGEHAKNAKQISDGVDRTRSGFTALDRARYEHDSDIANVNVKRHEQEVACIEMALDGIIETFKEALQSQQRAVDTMQTCMQTNQQTVMIPMGMKG